MPAGNCVISFINENAEGERGVSCSAVESEDAGIRCTSCNLPRWQTPANAHEASLPPDCEALVTGQHSELAVLTSTLI